MPAFKTPVSLEQMLEIASVAGNVAKQHFTHFGMERVVKSDQTPLTVADTEINRMFIEVIRDIAPDIDIVGEEESFRLGSDWQAVVDPIDGTFPYTWGMPVFTNMFGLLHKGQPIMGVIHDPMKNRTYHAERGKGAWMGEHRLAVSSAKSKEDRPVVGYVSWPGAPYNVLKACSYLEEQGVSLVNFCSIGYLEVAVATGELAGTIFPGTKHWDTAPGHNIVVEAGGMVTDILGNPIDYSEDKIEGHLMSNGAIHDLLVEAMRFANPH